MPTLPSPYAGISQVNVGGVSTRRASAEDFYVGGVGSAGRELQAVGDRILERTEQEESRKALVSSSEIRAKYARRLDEAANSGEDLAKIKEEMQTELSKIGEDFQTKQGSSSLQMYAANSELMYDEQANRITTQRAGAQARLDGQKLLNSESATLQTNPQYLPIAEKNIDAFVSTFDKIPTWARAQLGDELKKSLNMASAVASARIDPEGTKKKLETGEWNLTPEQRSTAINFTETEVRSRRAEDAYLRAEEDRARRERDEDARDTHFKAIMAGDRNVRREIMNDPALRPATREHLISFMEQRAKALQGEERRSNQQVLRDLTLSVMVPEGDPRKAYNSDAIVKAFDRGDINVTDFNRLVNQAHSLRDENNRSLSVRVGAIVNNMGRAFSQDPRYIGQPELVASIQNEYTNEVWRKMEDARKANRNPAELLDSDNKDFVGSAQFIGGVVASAKAKQQDALPKLPAPKTQAEYDALPAGAQYVDTDGRTKIKKSGAKPTEPKGPTSSGKIGGTP